MLFSGDCFGVCGHGKAAAWFAVSFIFIAVLLCGLYNFVGLVVQGVNPAWSSEK